MSKLFPQSSSKTQGLSLANLQSLTPQQRSLVNWIRRQDQCSLLDIAVHICQDEETAYQILLPLIKRGLIQPVSAGDDPIFRVKTAPKRGQSVFTKLKKSK